MCASERLGVWRECGLPQKAGNMCRCFGSGANERDLHFYAPRGGERVISRDRFQRFILHACELQVLLRLHTFFWIALYAEGAASHHPPSSLSTSTTICERRSATTAVNLGQTS
jgi:hypothetical protein